MGIETSTGSINPYPAVLRTATAVSGVHHTVSLGLTATAYCFLISYVPTVWCVG